MKSKNKIFGFTPTGKIPAYAYNSVMVLIGAYLLSDTWQQFFGLVFVLEAIIVSIERCWPKEERP